jgi:hypothetical protein
MAYQEDFDKGLSAVELATELTVAWLSNSNIGPMLMTYLHFCSGCMIQL